MDTFIFNISIKILRSMYNLWLISCDEFDIYTYATSSIIETLFSLISILVISIFFKNTSYTIIFLIYFALLRHHLNGYHCDTFSKCYVLSIIAYICISVICNKLYFISSIVIFITLLSSIHIFWVGCINDVNISLSSIEIHTSCKCTRVILILELIGILLASILSCKQLVLYLCLSIILCGLLLCLGQLKNYNKEI